MVRAADADAAPREVLPPLFAGVAPHSLRPPRVLLPAVERTALLARLEAPGPLVVVVAAPGGFGKTIALTQWAARDPRPFAWLQVEESHNDPLALLSHLTAALGEVADVDPAIAHWLQLAAPPVTERILPSLAASVAAARPFVLVLDDVHVLTNDACWQLMGIPLRSVPAGACVCTSGRRTPPVPLARFRAAGMLLEIGPVDLAMSSAEAAELLRRQEVTVDHAAVVRLERLTEGWPAGLHMAALAGSGQTGDGWLDGIAGHQRDISRFLAFEVLARQPEDVRAFLLETSILERLSVGICRAVTGRGDAADLLRRVVHENLFILAVDDRDEWFRYHHLFADFLRAELERRDGDALAALHARAAAWFEDHGQLEAAVRHWLAADEATRAAAVVCRGLMAYTSHARMETIRRWLDLFTDEQIHADEALTLTAGWIGSLTGDERSSRLWTSAVLPEQVAETVWPGGAVSLRAMQASLRATLGREGVTVMRAEAERAAELSGAADLVARAALHTTLGAAYWLTGDYYSAAQAFRLAEEEGAIANETAEIGAASLHALMLADDGRWEEAEALVEATVVHVEESGFSWMSVVAALVAHARVLAHRGDPQADEKLAAVGALTEQGTMPPWTWLLTAVQLAEALLERGDVEGAGLWVRKGFARLAMWPDAGILGARLQRLRARLERTRLLEPLTPAERRVLELLPTELSLREISERLGVSRDTVKTHVRELHRKLDVHGRSEAVARARELGLLP